MSQSLKRMLNSIEEVGDIAFTSSASVSDGQYQPDIGQHSDAFFDVPRHSQYIGPSCMNSRSDVPVMQPAESLLNVFGSILFEPSISDQMTLMNFYNPDDALTEWGDTITLPDFDLVQLTAGSSPQISYSPSQVPESSQLTAESVTPVGDEEIICYGMLHDVDVKLVGNMQTIDDKLGKSSDGYEYFELKKRAEEKENQVVLFFHDESKEEIGYLRSEVGKTLTPLLAKSYVDFEPRVITSKVKEAIGGATGPARAKVKVNINVYGRRGTATEVGDVLSRGKLWLQNPGRAKRDVTYDNPHFLPLKINSVQMRQSVQYVEYVGNEGARSQKRRDERLRKMVEEVYKSLNNTRHLDMADGGDWVTWELYKHQQEALGFMLERETGHINDRYRLWRKDILEDGSEEFRHRITKVKAKQVIKPGEWPDERGGGILADEMGLGKSLSILALITKTLDLGKEWAQQKTDIAGGIQAHRRSHATLVVVPSALLIENWTDEIEKHLKEGLQVVKYHGPGRPKDIDAISDSDIVVTTYNTITTEFQIKSKPSPLHRIDWYRVVLDEAHIIRRSATAFYHACDSLHANSRWCLTGTPIQNKLGDIGALFAFIRAEPFSEASVFRKWIEVPFEQSSEDPDAVRNRLVILLEALCLRRTKDIIQLPGLRQHMRKLTFSPVERQQYENTKKILMRSIRQRVSEIEKSSKFGLFQANLQLRLLCNHGTFQQPFSWHRRSYQDEHEAAVSALSRNGEITCSGCQLPMPILGSSLLGQGFREQCAHVLCSECIEQSSTSSPGAQAQNCPVCVRWLTHARVEANLAGQDEAIPDYPAQEAIEDEIISYFSADGYSTKMRALIEDVRKDLGTTKRHCTFPAPEMIDI